MPAAEICADLHVMLGWSFLILGTADPIHNDVNTTFAHPCGFPIFVLTNYLYSTIFLFISVMMVFPFTPGKLKSSTLPP
jgi:hypothetical protein